MIIAANKEMWAKIAFLGFRGVIPDKVAEQIRNAAKPPKEEHHE